MGFVAGTLVTLVIFRTPYSGAFCLAVLSGSLRGASWTAIFGNFCGPLGFDTCGAPGRTRVLAFSWASLVLFGGLVLWV